MCMIACLQNWQVIDSETKITCQLFMHNWRATKLPVLFRPYLLQFMYVTFQYLTVSCVPAKGHVPDIEYVCDWDISRFYVDVIDRNISLFAHMQIIWNVS